MGNAANSEITSGERALLPAPVGGREQAPRPENDYGRQNSSVLRGERLEPVIFFALLFGSSVNLVAGFDLSNQSESRQFFSFDFRAGQCLKVVTYRTVELITQISIVFLAEPGTGRPVFFIGTTGWG